MRKTSLLGHLAIKHIPQPENIATESLNHILSSSLIAKKSFLRYIEQTALKFSEDLQFRTQAVGEDGAIPDLVGIDFDGCQVLIIESKFWAGLTENQPVAYLKRLPESKNGVLLFIAPVRRIPSLWSELLRRCKNDNIIISETKPPISNEFVMAHFNTNQCLAVASWRSVLSYILRSVETEGEMDVASDIIQLLGLASQMDEDTFLPLNSEDLAPNIGTRVIQYCDLANDVTSLLVKDNMASTENLTTARSAGIYGRYLRISGFGCCLHFNASNWSNLRETPLWLSVFNAKWKFSQSAKECLSKLELEEPTRLFQVEDKLFIPLYLPTGVERDKVIDSLISQIREIAEYLKAGTP